MDADPPLPSPELVAGRFDLSNLEPAPARDGSPVERDRVIEAIEPMLGYLAVVARGLTADDKVGLERVSDLVQMTVVAALGNVARGRLPGDSKGQLKAWLRGILINVHRQSRRSRRPSDLPAEEIDAETTSPSGKASRSELAGRMAQARGRLRERDRQILDWRHEEKLTFETIGQRLGVSAVAAHKAHRAALHRLERAFLSLAAENAYRRSRESLEASYRMDEPPPLPQSPERPGHTLGDPTDDERPSAGV